MKTIVKISFLFIALSLTNPAGSQNWQGLGTGVDRFVYGMYNDTVSNLLYVCGDFKVANGMNMRGIATWNGSVWDSLGSGIDDDQVSFPARTNTICRYNNLIYVGGNFHKAGHIWKNSLAVWNGTNWDSLPGNLNGIVTNTMVYNNELYVCGGFTMVGTVSANGAAKWNGTNWITLSLPHFFNFNNVASMTMYNGQLYAGGMFNNGPTDSVTNIVKWNGSAWVSLGHGINGNPAFVSDMVVFNNELYVAGTFLTSDGNVGNNIQKWNGTAWSDVGGGFINGQVWKLKIINNELYAVGSFTYAGGVPAQKIAKWDGTNWCSFGDIFNNNNLAITDYNNEIYIGGGFTDISGFPLVRIAKWIGGNYVDTCGNTTGIGENVLDENSISVYPNPSSGKFHLQLNDLTFSKGVIEIYDLLGKIIYTSPISNSEMEIDLSGFECGVFFLKVKTENGVVTRKIIKE